MQTRFGSPNVSYDVKAHVEFTGIIAICNPKHLSQTKPAEVATKPCTVPPIFLGPSYGTCVV